MAVNILRDISSAMQFLHSATPPVIHGDLKSMNILVDNKNRAKIADFGLSSSSGRYGTGTPLWMAPELLRGDSGNTLATDVYSFGIILYEVYARRDPYEDEKDTIEVLRLVADRKIRFASDRQSLATCPRKTRLCLWIAWKMNQRKDPASRRWMCG
jgi:serine/threonine protein kinase